MMVLVEQQELPVNEITAESRIGQAKRRPFRAAFCATEPLLAYRFVGIQSVRRFSS
jgi:hypothetical protein